MKNKRSIQFETPVETPAPTEDAAVNSRKSSPEVVVDNNTQSIFSTARRNPLRLEWAFGATGVVFCLGCMLTMAIVPREKAVVLFNVGCTDSTSIQF